MTTAPNSDPNSFPDFDPSLAGSLSGLLKQFGEHLQKTTDGMLPATVVAYDRQSNLAVIQPAIHMVTTGGNLVGRAPLASIPVLALGGGGFFINFPLQAGARGWIKASDRDVSLYMQSGSASAPNTQRMHSFSDGLFIPDIVNGYTYNAADAGCMIVSSLDGTIRIRLSPNDVQIFAPNITANGVVHTTGDVIIAGKSFLSHTHGGIQPGGGMTGVPA